MKLSPRSFSGQLAVRFGATVLVAAGVTASFGYFALRGLLFDQLDQSLLRMAAIEAAAASDTQDSTVHFHEEIYLTATFGEEVTGGRFAQVWDVDGRSVMRSRNLGARDLPLDSTLRDRVAANLEPELVTLHWQGPRYRTVLYPLGLIGPNHEMHLLQVAASTSLAEAALARFARFLIASTFFAGAAGMLLGWWIARSTLRPISELVTQAEGIEMSGGTHRIEVDSTTEEMDRLVSVLNSMLSRIDVAFEGQRRFLSEVGHELRTPLTVLRGDVEVALRKPRSSEEYARVLEQSLVDLRSVSGLAEDLITLSRGENGGLAPAIGPVNVSDVLRRVFDRFAGSAHELGVTLEVDAPDSLSARVDGALVERALESLLDNALKYGASTVWLSAGLEVGDDGKGFVVIRVSDDGHGVAQHEAERIFEPFVRGAAGRRETTGSGLGLSIVRTIVESHGGSVRAAARPGGGSVFTVRLVAEQDPASATPVPEVGAVRV